MGFSTYARRRVHRWLVIPVLAALLTTVALLLAVSASVSAAASPPIERVWSFNGGEVAIQPATAGAFLGTVVEPTKFAQCAHAVGERMWTAIVPQPDGSYWGLHQWLYEPGCAPNQTRGPTALRVMESADGSSYLLVCFSSPGTTQPTIAANGVSANVTYGCVKSAEIAPVGGVESFAKGVELPSNGKCFSRRSLRIHLHQSKYDPFKEVLISLGKRREAVHRRGNAFAATINLKGLPRGAFTVKIRVTTVLGHHLDGRRTYHTCVGKIVKARR